MPETLAAVRNAARGRVQISLNLAYGSAMASIGLTIPVLAVASIWLAPPLELGLGPTELVLLAITFVTGALTAPLGAARSAGRRRPRAGRRRGSRAAARRRPSRARSPTSTPPSRRPCPRR